jgi:hypothetical protein
MQREVLRWLGDGDRLSLRRIFHGSSVPALSEMSGDFDAQLLNQGGILSSLLVRRVFGSHGAWMGKCFRPLSETTGIGHNFFWHEGRIVRKLPMETEITTSSLDDGQVMVLDYRARNRGPIRYLRGEVRQVIPGILLGMGIFGVRLGRRDRWRRKIPFIMVGPRRS